MSDDLDLPECPVCGEPVLEKTVIGPTEAVLGPCGHHVDPSEVDDE